MTELNEVEFLGRKVVVRPATQRTSAPKSGWYQTGPPNQQEGGSIPSCWFCLANPNADLQLVAAIGTSCYIALDKGALSWSVRLPAPLLLVVLSAVRVPLILASKTEAVGGLCAGVRRRTCSSSRSTTTHPARRCPSRRSPRWRTTSRRSGPASPPRAGSSSASNGDSPPSEAPTTLLAF